MFQSTYLYKVRPLPVVDRVTGSGFQSTYLYKVRHYGVGSTDAKAIVSIHVPI